MPTQPKGYPGFEGEVRFTRADSTPQFAPRRRVPPGAPNVIVILTDDFGFSDIGCYGAEIETPQLDALAANGVRLSNFHVSALCSPTRAALLTGLNPHDAGVGGLVGETGFPNNQGGIDPSAVTAAELFRANGYATLMVGKWHLTPTWDLSEAGDKRTWPCQRGFDRFYGFLTGFTNLHHPHRLYADNHPIDVDEYPEGYYFTDDITDQAIRMIDGVKAADPSQPFFLYMAHGATHAPLMAKDADIAKYRGRYDDGWDVVRTARFARQRELGILPEHAALPPRNEERLFDVPAWDSLSTEDRQVLARYMEVYAAMVDSIDQNLGRLTAALAEIGELDNTIILFTADNGASREGGPSGSTEYYRTVGLVADRQPDAATAVELVDEEAVARDRGRLDLIGGPRLMCHYPRGWATVSNTPFRLYKGSAFAGGHQVPCIISWPEKLPKGVIREHYTHVSDVLPTLANLAGLEPITKRDGHDVRTATGSSFTPALRDGDAAPTRTEQHLEIFGNRSFYREGWEAVTLHYAGTSFDDDTWQLFDLETDPAQTTDLASQEPDRTQALAAGWEEAAWRYRVFPLDDLLRGGGMHPDVMRLRTEPLRLLRRTPTASVMIMGRSFTIAISVDHRADDEGVLVAHGDQGGGYAVYVEDGQLSLAYNLYGDLTTVSYGALSPGAHVVDFAFDATDRGEWTIGASIDGTTAGQAHAFPMLSTLAPQEGVDVGIDRRSPVSWPVYERHGAFPYSGELHHVTYTPGDFAPGVMQMLAAQQREAEIKAQ